MSKSLVVVKPHNRTDTHPDGTLKPFDPAELGFPPMLPVELAMRTAPVSEICEAYGIDKDGFVALTNDPLFIQAYAGAKEMLQKDGMSFKIKARIQAEELLKKSWAMIHADHTPTAVKADLIKSTIRWAGYEPKNEGPGGTGNNAFQININLGS
jgi:hypothetical protein